MYEINIKDNFEKEVMSMLGKIEEKIRVLSEKTTQKETTPSTVASSKLNKLKVHRYKLSETLKSLAIMSDERWRKVRSDFKNIFMSAKETLKTTMV